MLTNAYGELEGFMSNYGKAISETNSHLTWDDYMRRDLAWLEVADAFFFIKESEGAVIEQQAAGKLGLDIYYTIGDVPTVRSKLYGVGKVRK